MFLVSGLISSCATVPQASRPMDETARPVEPAKASVPDNPLERVLSDAVVSVEDAVLSVVSAVPTTVGPTCDL